MSGSGDEVDAPNLDNGGSLLAWSANRITTDGWGIGRFIRSGIGLLIAGVFALAFDMLNAIVGFVTDPLNSASSAVSSLFEGLLTSPLSILSGTAATTAAEISATFTGFLGPLAFPVGVASVMLGLWVVTVYLERRETSDLFPGSFTDVDTPNWLESIGLPEPGVEEEGEDQTGEEE